MLVAAHNDMAVLGKAWHGSDDGKVRTETRGKAGFSVLGLCRVRTREWFGALSELGSCCAG